jgi:hypothetical protein
MAVMVALAAVAVKQAVLVALAIRRVFHQAKEITALQLLLIMALDKVLVVQTR